MVYLFDHCPLLNSFYEEVVRRTTFSIGAREVVDEVTIGGKVLHPGRKLLMPFQQMHLDTRVFGDNATEFDPRRFLNNPSLVRSTIYRPFGGGSTYCPGRFLARREIFMFVVLLLHRFDIDLEPRKEIKFPEMDDSISSVGVMGPRLGDDLMISVRPACMTPIAERCSRNSFLQD
ncbi:hypothetical protein OCU04_007647 [Sclerotinia nivalis]|uniref:Cytochrome P450 n=1 Tax=Sclerotinia nivalis TaxID=352851 RepID=A0A9X0AJ74_9HELO|nr:hypothetical protein OCU04_007647 [Sclerotinia nivalis]